MATWWRPVNSHPDGDPIEPFCITNRFWYTLRALLVAGGARNTERLESLDGIPLAIPSTLANHWGSVLLHLDLTQWVQVMEWDGNAFVPTRIAPLTQAATLLDTCELVELSQTPTADWIRDIADQMANTKIGLTIDGRPGRKYPMTALINLSKPGERVNLIDLAKQGGNTNLTKLRIELGWDTRKGTGDPYDLDASVVCCEDDGLSAGQATFCFYNNPTIAFNGVPAIVHSGDNRTGDSDGADETITVDLSVIPTHIHSLEVLVTIHQALARNQTFARVNNAWVRIVDDSNGVELLKYDLSEQSGTTWNAVNFCSLYRNGGDWKFKSNGDEGFTRELQGFVDDYKIARK